MSSILSLLKSHTPAILPRKLPIVLLITTGILFSPPPKQAERVSDNNKIVIGEIERIDPVNRILLIRVFSPQDFLRLPENSLFSLLDENHNEIGKLEGFRTVTLDNRIYLSSPPPITDYTLHSGQLVGVEIPHVVRGELPDYQMGRQTPQPVLYGKNSHQMILVESGPFVFGSDIAGANHYTSPIENYRTKTQTELAVKRVRYLDQKSYYIDIYEVTRGQFQQYLLESGAEPPPGWDAATPNLPITNASYTQAESYCRWAGKRLPTELEWEKAARGAGLDVSYTYNEQKVYTEKISIYPMGLEFDSASCITIDTLAAPQSVYTLKDRSPYGIYGACGNAAEWTSSWYLPYRGNTLQNPDFGRKYKVIRGGAYNLPSAWTKTYERMTGGIPSLNSDYRAGFRCAGDVL